MFIWISVYGFLPTPELRMTIYLTVHHDVGRDSTRLQPTVVKLRLHWFCTWGNDCWYKHPTEVSKESSLNVHSQGR